MPHNCFALGCKNYYKKGGGVQFFGFPLKNKDLLQSWISNVGRPDCSPTAASKLCSDHFKEGDYLVRPGTYIRRLKPDAVPTIFSDIPKHLKKKVTKRRSLKKTKLDKITEQKPMEISESIPCTSAIDPLSNNNKENCEDVLDKNEISGTDNEINDVPNKLNKEVETDNADTKSVSPKHLQKKVNNRRSFKQAILYKFIHQKPMEIKETKLSTSMIIPISDNISTNNKESHGDVLDKYRISGTDNKVVNVPDKLDKKVQTDRKIVDKEVRLKIKTLQQKIRRQNNTIIRLKQLVKTLRGKSFLQQDMEQFLMDQLEDSSSVYIINVP